MIKISSGCLFNCTFCAVKISRGAINSRKIEEILEEFRTGLSQGYREFALVGTDLGSYGRDIQTDLVDLLREMVKVEGDYRIRLRNLQPHFLIEMSAGMKEVLNSGRIDFISSACQSGSNEILERMQRGYSIEDYKRVILDLRDSFPFLKVRSQVMIGFPGETEENFEDTLKLMQEVQLDFVEVYIFQPRIGTKAYTMPGRIPWQVAKEREHRLYWTLLKLEMMKLFGISKKRVLVN